MSVLLVMVLVPLLVLLLLVLLILDRLVVAVCSVECSEGGGRRGTTCVLASGG